MEKGLITVLMLAVATKQSEVSTILVTRATGLPIDHLFGRSLV